MLNNICHRDDVVAVAAAVKLVEAAGPDRHPIGLGSPFGGLRVELDPFGLVAILLHQIREQPVRAAHIEAPAGREIRLDAIDVVAKLRHHWLIVDRGADQLLMIVAGIKFSDLVRSWHRMREVQAAFAARQKPILAAVAAAKDQLSRGSAQRTCRIACNSLGCIRDSSDQICLR